MARGFCRLEETLFLTSLVGKLHGKFCHLLLAAQGAGPTPALPSLLRGLHVPAVIQMLRKLEQDKCVVSEASFFISVTLLLTVKVALDGRRLSSAEFATVIILATICFCLYSAIMC